MSIAPKISIIVPIYNMEALLERALNSILAQTFLEWECLLVDDGSTDRSSKICDEYAKKDSRFRAFHKKNGGVSSARQCGLDNALGVYTIHVDPDDWIDSDMLESLYHVAENENADMVICDFIIETQNGSFYNIQKPVSLDPLAIMKQIMMMELGGYCWNKLIRRSCYLNNNITFPEKMIMWEDLFVCCRILQENICVAYIPKALYHYDRVSNGFSVVAGSSRKKVESKKYLIDFFEPNLGNLIDFYSIKKDVKLGMVYLLEMKPEEIQKEEIINTYADMNVILLEKLVFSFRRPLDNALKLIISGKSVEFVLMYLKFHRKILWLLSFIKHKIFLETIESVGTGIE